MTKSEGWFQNLEQIWRGKRVNDVGELVAVEFCYYEDQLLPPITTVEDLETVWQEINEQDIRTLAITSLYCTDEVGVASYHFVVSIKDKEHESWGVYFVRLDQSGRATEFRQWYVESK